MHNLRFIYTFNMNSLYTSDIDIVNLSPPAYVHLLSIFLPARLLVAGRLYIAYATNSTSITGKDCSGWLDSNST